VRWDFGGHDASKAQVTERRRFTDMKSATVGEIPSWRACLAPKGFQKMTITSEKKTWWSPFPSFIQCGIKNGPQVNALIQQGIQDGVPIVVGDTSAEPTTMDHDTPDRIVFASHRTFQ